MLKHSTKNGVLEDNKTSELIQSVTAEKKLSTILTQDEIEAILNAPLSEIVNKFIGTRWRINRSTFKRNIAIIACELITRWFHSFYNLPFSCEMISVRERNAYGYSRHNTVRIVPDINRQTNRLHDIYNKNGDGVRYITFITEPCDVPKKYRSSSERGQIIKYVVIDGEPDTTINSLLYEAHYHYEFTKDMSCGMNVLCYHKPLEEIECSAEYR